MDVNDVPLFFQMDAKILTLSLMWAVAACGVAMYVLEVARQITYVTLADGRRQERRLPILLRLMLPLAGNMAPRFRTGALMTAREAVARRIVAAGFDGMLTAEEFLALKVLMPLCFGVALWIPLVWGLTAAANVKFLNDFCPIFCAFGPALFYVYPGMWLSRSLIVRHRSIQKSLPFVLDLLTLSVEAGLDFMTALQRNVERSVVDPLNEELIRVVREIQIGKTRREALRDLGRRVDLSDLKSVVNSLVQADELGVSIGSVLRILSNQMRQRRFERAEKMANEAPVKLLGPLLFCIFPAVLLILIAPVLYRAWVQGL